MVIIQQLIASLMMLVNIVFTLLYWLLVARIVLSWVGVNPYRTSHELLGALFQVTDVILRPFQRLPLQIGLLDLSPVVAFVALNFVQRLLIIGLSSLAGLLS